MLTQPLQCENGNLSNRQFIGSINRLAGNFLLGLPPVIGGFFMRTTRSNPRLRAWWGLWRLRTATQWLLMAGFNPPTCPVAYATPARPVRPDVHSIKNILNATWAGLETSLAPLYRKQCNKSLYFIGGYFLFHHYPKGVTEHG